MSVKWPNEVVYQIFPDRWLNGDPVNDVRTGDFEWHGKPARKSARVDQLTDPRLHQRLFYGGDLAGIAKSVPYLSALGVTAVYLTPIFASRSSHGYDADDYFRIAPHFGTRGEYLDLVRILHAAGIKLVLDGVFNHTSFEHPWYADVRTRGDFYCMKTSRRTMTWMNGSTLPKLNPENPRVEAELLRVISAWPEIDGWRLDAAHLLPRRFLRKFKARVESTRPNGIVVMEDWTDSSEHFRDGLCDGVTNFLFRDAVERFFVEDCSAETFLKRLVTWIHRYPWPNVVQSWNLLDNHDTPRFLNRVGLDRRRLMLAQVLQFTLPGTPMLYQGDEIGMTGTHDGEARAPMVWDRKKWDRKILRHVRKLIQLRKRHPVLSLGSWRPLLAANASRAVAFERRLRSGARAVIALNDGYRPYRFDLGIFRKTLPPRGHLIWISDRRTPGRFV
ncbi:glycoside hydrolase family 13 protein [bacterium]|nr:glycoside hydrolase family 13 protein [bacterium]